MFAAGGWWQRDGQRTGKGDGGGRPPCLRRKVDVAERDLAFRYRCEEIEFVVTQRDDATEYRAEPSLGFSEHSLISRHGGALTSVVVVGTFRHGESHLHGFGFLVVRLARRCTGCPHPSRGLGR